MSEIEELQEKIANLEKGIADFKRYIKQTELLEQIPEQQIKSFVDLVKYHRNRQHSEFVVEYWFDEHMYSGFFVRSMQEAFRCQIKHEKEQNRYRVFL